MGFRLSQCGEPWKPIRDSVSFALTGLGSSVIMSSVLLDIKLSYKNEREESRISSLALFVLRRYFQNGAGHI